jgi:CheY-like chemotaxis protein
VLQEAIMPDFDVVFIDDEVSLTEIFQHYVLWKYKDWRFATFTNPNLVYQEIVNNNLNATVWIVDMMMPGKNGAQVAGAIRKKLGNTPVIYAYTALDREELVKKDEYKDGMVHFNQVINKREDLPGLLSLVDIWIVRE